QDTERALSDDGLDAAVCHVKPGQNELVFAGARIPLVRVQNGQCSVIKGDRQSIGYRRSDLNFDYTNHQITIGNEMSFYLATDGFTDQLGGKKRIKFGKTRFISLLEDNHEKPFEEQREALLQAFEDYKGGNERQDDVTVVGFRF
ncbi:MAG: SpoIIE family protein phosphatase, partial [bacterium]|nr:SpoIIE family protein phosphatase [bacterium]